MHGVKARLSQARETFWILPAVAIVAAVGLGLALPQLDRGVTVPDAFALSGKEDTARAALGAIATVGVSVAGVSFSVIVVALVLASQQLSPRVLRSFQRQPINQGVLALLLGTAVYALFVLSAVSEEKERPVPELSVSIAMFLSAASLVLFVIFVHHAVRSLNASAVIRRIAADGHRALPAPYPDGVGREAEDELAAERAALERTDGADGIEVRAPRAGYVASVEGDRIVAWAAEHDAFVEQRRPVGAFTVTGGILAVVHGVDDEAACGAVGDAFLLDEERVVDGDVAFPVRQLADIALKGLSPGINDPTTSENAMDSVADTLVRYARRDEPAALRLDADGVPRLRAIAPTLDDLVRLGFDQVRRDAANRPPFSVRLLELLADIREAAPRARDSAEIERQAELIAAQASSLADQQADHRMVLEAHERLHGARRP